VTDLALRPEHRVTPVYPPTPRTSGGRLRPTIGAPYVAVTVNVPTTGPTTHAFVVRVPNQELVRNAVFGAVLYSAIPRTQGLHFDQYRTVLLALARNWGRVRDTDPQERVVVTSEPLTEVLARLRGQTRLPAAEIARMLGIQRRQLYNLVDGGSTTPDRERRIRALAHLVDRLFERLNDVGLVRSALLAPIGRDLRSFVDLATEGGGIAEAGNLLEGYLDARGDAIRRYVQTPRRARKHEGSAAKAIEDTLDISPDDG
jgi:hypothetical protein